MPSCFLRRRRQPALLRILRSLVSAASRESGQRDERGSDPLGSHPAVPAASAASLFPSKGSPVADAWFIGRIPNPVILSAQ